MQQLGARTLVKWMTLEERAAPTKPCGWEGSCKKRVSRGMSPSGPSLMVCTTSRFSQSQNVSVSPYAVGTSAGLKPCHSTSRESGPGVLHQTLTSAADKIQRSVELMLQPCYCSQC